MYHIMKHLDVPLFIDFMTSHYMQYGGNITKFSNFEKYYEHKYYEVDFKNKKCIKIILFTKMF